MVGDGPPLSARVPSAASAKVMPVTQAGSGAVPVVWFMGHCRLPLPIEAPWHCIGRAAVVGGVVHEQRVVDGEGGAAGDGGGEVAAAAVAEVAGEGAVGERAAVAEDRHRAAEPLGRVVAGEGDVGEVEVGVVGLDGAGARGRVGGERRRRDHEVAVVQVERAAAAAEVLPSKSD